MDSSPRPRGTMGWPPLFFPVLFALVPSMGRGVETASARDLKKLSLAELMEVEVTTVSRKPERLSETAAALTVLRGDDIRRSGVTTIADALRLAPGVHVAQIDANKWAVGIRGFASRLSRSVLALADGRTLYTPLFAGVYWEQHDMPLDDVERIEVIRGPGGSLWGANAYSGVVNIISKPARDTEGWLVTAGGGNAERGFGGFRYGGRLGDGVFYRVYGKYFDRGPGFHAAGKPFDDWRMGRTGFRLDWERGGETGLTVMGNAYDGRTGQSARIATFSPPFSETLARDAELSGQNVQARWRTELTGGGDLDLRAWYDRTRRVEPHFQETRHTIDFELKHRFGLSDAHELHWGAGYRVSADDTSAVATIAFAPASRTLGLFSAFVQDDFDVVSDRLRLIVGSKLEHNDFTGFEVQPSARLSFRSERQALWVALSRAVRSPSRVEHDLSLTAPPIPSTGLFPRVLGDSAFASEELVAWEAGHRVRLGERAFLDTAVFFNRYDNALSLEPGDVFSEAGEGAPREVLPFLLRNKLEGESYGAEIAAELFPKEGWRLRATYAFIDLELRREPDSRDPISTAAAGATPRHQGTLWSYVALGRGVELDVGARAASALASQPVPGYFALDSRLEWQANERLTLSLVARNLLDSHHVEFVEAGRTVGVERSFYARVDLRF